jgi:hypothetical protein
MPMVAFYSRCLETAQRETRGVTLAPNPDLPEGQFIFTELYCDDPECECRRVIFLVQPRGDLSTVLATLNFGWESAAFYAAWSHDEEMAAEMAGLTVEPFGRQTEYANAFFDLAEEILIGDAAYVERLKRHYAEFRATLPPSKKLRGIAGVERRRRS